MNPIRQALQGDRSVLVDIETFGLGKGDPIHEISILHASKRKAVEIVPKPMGVRSLDPGVDPVRAPVDKRKIKRWDSWTAAIADNPDSYAAKHKSRHPHLEGKTQKPFRKVRYGDDVVRVKHVAGLSAKEALSTTLDLIKNKTVWIANVPFEASRLGLVAEVTKQGNRVVDQATYGGRNPFQSLLVSDPGVLEARIRAHRTGDWTGVYDAMMKVDYNAKGTKVFDIQDLVRATQSFGDKYSKAAGLGLDFSEVYQGTSLNVQARLLGLPKEAHTAVKDNILAQRVGLKMVDHIEALEGMTARLHNATGAALNPTSDSEKSAVDWLYRMHSYKQRARESYLDQRLARAHTDISQNKPHGVYTGESVYKTTKKHRGKKVPARVGMPQITDMNGMDEVIAHLSSRPEYSKIDVGARYRKMRDAGAASNDASFFKNFQNSASSAADSILDDVMADKPNFKFGEGVKPSTIVNGPRFDPRVGRLSGHEYLKRVGKKTGLGLGLLALTGVIGASSRISSKDDEYNTIEGMGEDNYAAYLRHGGTDFGSGWRRGIGMLLAGATIGGGLGINSELSTGMVDVASQTSITGSSLITRESKPLKGVSLIMMEEAYDSAADSGWASSKAQAEKYGAKIFPVGPNYPLDDALAAVNANTESNRVFILSHGNNGTAMKFTGAGAHAHENIVASLGYINNRLDSRFTVDLGACNAQYLLNFDELNVKEVNKNLHELGSHAPNAWYNEASAPDNVRKFRAYATHGVGLGIFPLTMNETSVGAGWTTTPASGALDDIAFGPELIGERVSYNKYVSGDGTSGKIGQAYASKVLFQLDQPEVITATKFTTSNNIDEVIGNMDRRLVAGGKLGSQLGGFAGGLAGLAAGLAGKRKGLTNAVKAAAAIPVSWAHKGVAGLTTAKNFAGRTGQSIMGSVNSTGKNFRNFATSTGQAIGGSISAGVGSVRAGLTKTKDIIGGKMSAAQDWTHTRRVSTANSIGRMKKQLISASSVAQTRRPTISMPRSPGALASAAISSRVESTLSGPARVHVGPGRRVETTRFNRTAPLLNNPSLGSYDIGGRAANNSYGFESRPAIGALGTPARAPTQRNFRMGRTAPSMGVASVVAGSGRRIETTRFGAMPYPTGRGNARFGALSTPGKVSRGAVGLSRILPRRPEAQAVDEILRPKRTYASGPGGTSRRNVKPNYRANEINAMMGSRERFSSVGFPQKAAARGNVGFSRILPERPAVSVASNEAMSPAGNVGPKKTNFRRGTGRHTAAPNKHVKTLLDFYKTEKPLYHMVSEGNLEGFLGSGKVMTSNEAVARRLATEVEAGGGMGRGAPRTQSVGKLGKNAMRVSAQDMISGTHDFLQARKLASISERGVRGLYAQQEAASTGIRGVSKTWNSISFSTGPWEAYGPAGVATKQSMVRGHLAGIGGDVEFTAHGIPSYRNNLLKHVTLPQAEGLTIYNPKTVPKHLRGQFKKSGAVPINDRTNIAMNNLERKYKNAGYVDLEDGNGGLPSKRLVDKATNKLNPPVKAAPAAAVAPVPAANTPVAVSKRAYRSGVGGTSRRYVQSPIAAAIEAVQTPSGPIASGRNYRSGVGGTSKRHVKPIEPTRIRDFNKIDDALWDDTLDKATAPKARLKSSAAIQAAPAPSAPSAAPSVAPTPVSSSAHSAPPPAAKGRGGPSFQSHSTPKAASQPVQAAVNAAPKPGPVSQAVTKQAKSRFGLGVAAAAIAAVGLGVMMFSGKGSSYNEQEGMSEQGVAAANRKHSTDFGSPYQGIWGSVSSQIAGSLANGGSTPNYVNGVPINQEVSDFRDQHMQTPLQKRIIEAEMTKQSLKSMNRLYFLDPALTTSVASSDYGLSGHKDLQHVSLSQVDWSVEDADTIIMKHGVRGMMGQEMQIRLAGIDAPEVQHDDESIDMLRYKQGQPHGEAARERLREILTNAKEVEVVSDPSQATYGRGLGVLFADGENVNLQLIREGHVAALPFGERSADLLNRDAAMNAERGAYQGHRGMWQNEYWRTYRNSVSEHSRVTFNTLSRKDKLAGNMNLAGLEATMSMAQEDGPSRMTMMAENALRPKLANIGKKKVFKDNTFTVDYHTQAKHLDQLKLETQRHMNTYGTQVNGGNLNASSRHGANQSVVSDSLGSSHSIYNDELPTIIDKYTRKAGKRKLQAESQRAANKFMNTKNRYGGE